MTSRDRVRTRLLILSDTHSALPGPEYNPAYPWTQPFPPADVAIHSGDLTSNGKIEEHKHAVQLLKSLPAPLKIVIPGNHDLTLDRAYCARIYASHRLLHNWQESHTAPDLDIAEELYTSQDAREAGIVYLVEGTHRFRLANGANLVVYASAYTPEFCDWAFAYPREEDRWNTTNTNKPAKPVPSLDFDTSGLITDSPQIDVMITHGPPMGILDETTSHEHVGCAHLAKAVERCRPLLHCFGHIHEGWGYQRKSWSFDAWKDDFEPRSIGAAPAEWGKEQERDVGYIDATSVQRGEETVFVNASIMSVAYSPCQKPWIVDLMLHATQLT